MNWKNWEIQQEQHLKILKSLWELETQNIPILHLWMNWEKLYPNLNFTVENKMGNFHEIRLLTFQM